MTKLNSRDRGLLDLARAVHEPSQADRHRMRARLAKRLGVGAGLLLTTPAVSASASVSGLLTVKVLLPLLLSGLLTGLGVVAYRGAHAADAPRPSAPTSGQAPSSVREPLPSSPKPASVVPVETFELTAPSAPSEAPGRGSSAASVAESDPTSRSLGASERSVRASQPSESSALRGDSPLTGREGLVGEPRAVAQYPVLPAEAAPAGARSAVSAAAAVGPAPRANYALQAETRLVRAGLAALHAGDPARALALFDEHARSYPNGILADERAAERIVSLCELGRASEARTAALLFLRDHRTSPLSERVRSSCAAASNP